MKKIISTAALLGIGLSLMAPAYAQGDSAFNDVLSSYEYADAVNYLKEQNIVEGYADGSFKPTAGINRAEFLKISMQMVEDADEKLKECVTKEKFPNATVYFPDVPRDAWFAPYACVAKEHGLVKGYADGMLRPERKISFAEASKITLKAFGHNLADGPEVWYSNYVSKMDSLRAIPTSVKDPHTMLNRGEMSEIVWRIRTKNTDRPSKTAAQLEKALATPAVMADSAFPKIASCSELQTKIEAASNQRGYREFGALPVMLEEADGAAESEAVTAAPMAKTTAAPGSAGASGEMKSEAADDFSSTNIQVKGVDEADIVKNDGEFIYTIRKDTVRIIKAFPVEKMEALSTVSFNDSRFYPSQMYVAGDKMVVIGNSYYPGSAMTEARALLPYERGSDRTKVVIIDISDRLNPLVEREVAFEGNYTSSRRVGDYMYLVMNKYHYYYRDLPMPLLEGEDSKAANSLVPRVSDSAEGEGDMPMVGCGDVHYFPGFKSTNYLVVAAVPVQDTKEDITKKVFLGASENIYSSTKSLYVASTDYNYGLEVDEETGEVTEEDDDTAKTVVYKFALDKNDISFQAKGKVPGRILNQFSMDEHNNHFRIATTIDQNWRTDELSTNNMYVLDSDMEMVGKIEEIAPDESIYSVRFMGDRAYMVTFKKIDPFFVIDLSVPTAPRILGKLKIPGYSDYLHPYDDNHIIGFGKEAVESEDGNFALFQGFKMAIFDVTDVASPKELHKLEIGDRGTQSELLYNHKALLFDRSKKLLAFPISVAEIPKKEDDKKSEGDIKIEEDFDNEWAYGETVFQGAHVYNVDLKDGFKLRGTVTHFPEDTKKNNFWDNAYRINRILYIGDYLYTVSQDVVKAVTMNTVKEKNKVYLYKKPEPRSNTEPENKTMVDSIDINILESFPVQVRAVVKGTLRDGCEQVGEITKERDGTTFFVTIEAKHPGKDAVCTAIARPYEQDLSLDVVGLKAGTYTVNVNGKLATFTLDADNE